MFDGRRALNAFTQPHPDIRLRTNWPLRGASLPEHATPETGILRVREIASAQVDRPPQKLQARRVSVDLTGTWKLIGWRRIAEDGTVTHPLGEHPHGLLIYAANGRMAVQMTAADRPRLDTGDPVGGDAQARADAYSTCLAYFGTYELRGEEVVHRIDMSLFPNWSGQEQVRPFTLEDGELTLRTPPTPGPNGTVVNEIAWSRER
jgi:hypothetical protein